MAELHDLSPSPGSHRDRKRLGRGPGSGTGKTSGKGHKGQKARSGGSVPAWFEGGQMPLQRRLPKRGFKNIHRVDYQGVNVRDLNRVDPGEVNPEVMKAFGLIGTLKKPVKILGTGEIEGAYQVLAHGFSAAARAKIEAAGGSVTVVGTSATDEPKAPAAVGDVSESEEAPSPRGNEASEAEDERA